MKKLCILGTSETWKEAPYGNPDFEFWALNDMYVYEPIMSSVTRWFEMHNTPFLKQYVARVSGKKHWDCLKELNIPIYMQDAQSDIPTSLKYPLERVINTFGRRYFGSTVDYMIALALMEGFEEIRIYGVNMALSDEYSFQKPSCEYWIGRAEGMGVKIFLPEKSDLLKCYHIYGYETDKYDALESTLKSRLLKLERESVEFQKNYYLSMGAKDAYENMLRDIGG